ncbi:MAG: dCMP deaminase family protein [Oscillospiraceae bacterium]|nr:dCMP deaminase family protein [Oscillospiraceae bacterium]
MKRQDYIGWDAYFMGIALLSAQRSKDDHTQVGACIVNAEKKIVSVGYNGMPRGCSDDELPWEREGEFLATKYPYVCHAELNAILNSNVPLHDCTLYVTLFPCNECAKAIIQSGIRRVVYLSDKYAGTEANTASRTMLNMAGVETEQYLPNGSEITLAL